MELIWLTWGPCLLSIFPDWVFLKVLLWPQSECMWSLRFPKSIWYPTVCSSPLHLYSRPRWACKPLHSHRRSNLYSGYCKSVSAVLCDMTLYCHLVVENMMRYAVMPIQQMGYESNSKDKSCMGSLCRNQHAGEPELSELQLKHCSQPRDKTFTHLHVSHWTLRPNFWWAFMHFFLFPGAGVGWGPCLWAF